MKSLIVPEYPQVKGVSLGGCIEGIDDRGKLYRFRRQGHAHFWTEAQIKRGLRYPGWICILSGKEERWRNPVTGKLTKLALHEIAHILTPGHGHDHIWMKKCREIGGNVEKMYQRYSPVSYKKFLAKV